MMTRVTGNGADMADPKLIRINLRPHATTQAPERIAFLNVGGSVTPFSASWAAFLGEDADRFVAEVEAVKDHWNERDY
jgi:60 kDa SS-A/Ro ribonucleoprotein